MSCYPSLPEALQSTTLPVLFRVRRSIRSILSSIGYFLISTLVVGAIITFTPPQLANSTLSIPLRVLCLVPIVFLLNVVRHIYDKVYDFELHKLIEVSGRLSLNLVRPSINYVDIRAINVTQDIFGRILGYGNIELGTAGSDGYEILLLGVKSPHELARLIDQLKSHSAAVISQERGSDISVGALSGGGGSGNTVSVD